MRSMHMLGMLLAGALLTAPGQAAGPAAAPGSAKSPEKLICKKTLETGSLVRKKKECLTQAEWNRVAENHQKFGRDMVDNFATRPGGQ